MAPAVGIATFVNALALPEPLRETLPCFWSRRIDVTHRMVYCVDEQALVVIACRYHYQ